MTPSQGQGVEGAAAPSTRLVFWRRLGFLFALMYVSEDYPIVLPMEYLYQALIPHTGAQLALFYWHTVNVFTNLILSAALAWLGFRWFGLSPTTIGIKKTDLRALLQCGLGAAAGFSLTAIECWGWNQLPNFFRYGRLPGRVWIEAAHAWTELADPARIAELVYYWTLTPISEELLRAVMFTAIRNKTGMWWALGITSLFSALSHFHFSHGAPLTAEAFLLQFTAACVFGGIYHLSGALWAPLAAHASGNFLSTWFDWLVHFPPNY